MLIYAYSNTNVSATTMKLEYLPSQSLPGLGFVAPLACLLDPPEEGLGGAPEPRRHRHLHEGECGQVEGGVDERGDLADVDPGRVVVDDDGDHDDEELGRPGEQVADRGDRVALVKAPNLA